jgi:hypothetical protein
VRREEDVMAVSQAEYTSAKGFFFDLDILGTNASDEITTIVASVRGINGSATSAVRRRRPVDYRLLADVSDLRSGLPEVWIVSPAADQIEHVNIWPASMNCALTGTRMPRLCWGDGSESWMQKPTAERTLSSFLEVARQVLNGANLSSPCR